MRELGARTGLVWYYLATPVFALVDLGLGFPVRVAAVLEPFHRMVYYAVLMALGLVVRVRPRLAPWVGMGESVTALILLLLSVLLPIWSLPDGLAAPGATPAAGLNPAGAVNALVVGSALVVAFQRHQVAALGSGHAGRL